MKTITAVKDGIIINYDDFSVKTKKIKYGSELVINDNQPIQFSRELNLNVIQKRMLDRLYLGLDMYSLEEQKTMSKSIKDRIQKVHLKAKYLVHKLKVDKFFYAENKLFNSIFPNVNLGTKILDYTYCVEEVTKKTTTQLKISKEEIISVFIKAELLPVNFYEIGIEPKILETESI